MLRNRIVPVLLLQGSGFIKTKKFKKYKYLGDSINTVRLFNEHCVDELSVFDPSATRENREPNYKKLEHIAREANMPLAYGGGIQSASQARRLIEIGFEKVSLSTKVVTSNGDIIDDIADQIGAQSVVVTLDYSENFFGKKTIFRDSGTRNSGINLIDLIKKIESRHYGELILQNVKEDGLRRGMDISTFDEVRPLTSKQLSLSCGLSSFSEIESLSQQREPMGIYGSSVFVLKGKLDAVLISYPER